MTGLEVHATAFSNLVQRCWLTRLPLAAEITLVVLCGLVIGWLANFVSPQRGVLGLGACAILVAVGACLLVWRSHLWFN